MRIALIIGDMRDGKRTFASSHNPSREYAIVFGAISVVTVCIWFTTSLSYLSLGYIYLLAVIALSTRVRRLPALSAAVLSSLAWDFFFVPPRLSFSILRFDETLLMTTFFVVALIGSQLTALRSAEDRAKLLAESELMHQTLLDSIAHELKTPVAVFHTAVEQLGTEDPVKREHLMAEVRIAVQRLDNIVSNLLNQTRLESGVLSPRLDWCNAGEVIEAARRAVSRRLEGHPVTVFVPSDLPIILADAVLLEEAFANLLLNAAVHTSPGVPIRVEARLDAEGKYILMSVSDEGPGIPAEIRAAIFDKFRRGPNARVGGLGLGLSIVKGFIIAQGGDVTVDSEPGHGACFTLSLPHVSPAAIPHG
jgi:K+-sensing histidine kinase KdpD